jgi:hypothetical protein
VFPERKDLSMNPRTLVCAFFLVALPRLALAQDTTLTSPIYAGTTLQSTLSESAPMQGQTTLSPKATTSVDPSTGAVASTFAFQLQTARGGAQPTLALSYNSQAPNVIGFAGTGWTLTGTPSIVRKGAAGMPRFIDDVFDTPGLGHPFDPNAGNSITDSYMMGGNLLVPICIVAQCGSELLPGEIMPFGLPGVPDLGRFMYFRLEQDDGARYFFSPDGQTWIKQEKSGLVTEFGHPLDRASVDPSLGDAIERPAPTTNFLSSEVVASQAVYRWDIVRQIDVVGNTVYYVWTNNPSQLATSTAYFGQMFLSDVYDTLAVGSTATPASFAHHTRLTWQRAFGVPDQHAPIWLAQPFAGVEYVDVTSASWMSTARSLVRRYSLTYASNAGNTISRLQSITLEGECGTQGNLSPVGEVNGAAPIPSGCASPNTLNLVTYGYYADADYQTLDNQGTAFTLTQDFLNGTTGQPWFEDLSRDGASDMVYLTNTGLYGQAYLGSPFPLRDPTNGALSPNWAVGLTGQGLATTQAPFIPGDWLADGSLNWITELSFGQWNVYTVDDYSFRGFSGIEFLAAPPGTDFSIGACALLNVCDTGRSTDTDGDGLTDQVLVPTSAAVGAYAQAFLSTRAHDGTISAMNVATKPFPALRRMWGQRESPVRARAWRGARSRDA